MKYVRTKDHIEEVLQEEGELLFTRHGYIPKSMVIGKADEIAELFDNVLLVKKEADGTMPDVRLYKKIVGRLPLDAIYCIMDGYVAYGTIWTDRGQIYAAKLDGVTKTYDLGEWKIL